ncbi:MAG: carbohydrate-binding domain-containing protein [Desulfobacteraceae bacterium]|nr:carbohydrate-binding domain-containing protein [Desulfobacteraceae bacterium]MBU4038072.1 carbohydrate-binding domain-containing protein [Pseudomonadota bacterium]
MEAGKLFRLFCAFMIALSIGGCGGSGGSGSTPSSDAIDVSSFSTIDDSLYAISVADTADTYDAADLVENTTFDYFIDINFTENTAGLSSGPAQDISETENTLLAVGSQSVTIAKTDYGITVRSSMDAVIGYNLSGALTGTFTLSSSSNIPYPYQIRLNEATISGTAGPALDLESSQKAYIVTASGTTNRLTDSSTRSMTMKAALYGKGPMVFSGDGTLFVSGDYKHGIYSDDYIRVCRGMLDVAVSTKDAIRSVNGFIFDDGDLTITATGTKVDDESKGIKVEGSEETGPGKGYIVINGGYIDITSVGKAITAGWDIDEDAETVTTSDDPFPYVVINNGVISITTTGSPYEYVSEGKTISCSPEGIEGKTDLTINSGYIQINSTDDSLNSGEELSINGGYVYCQSSKNDAVDSNGRITIRGGVIVAIGSSKPEGSFDCDQSDFIITGGTVVGIGGTISQPTVSPNVQNMVVLGWITTGTTMAIKTSSGETLFIFTIPQPYETMILSSPNLAAGSNLTLYSGGKGSSDDMFYGLYLGSLAYSGGSTGPTFNGLSKLTKLGGTYF